MYWISKPCDLHDSSSNSVGKPIAATLRAVKIKLSQPCIDAWLCILTRLICHTVETVADSENVIFIPVSVFVSSYRSILKKAVFVATVQIMFYHAMLQAMCRQIDHFTVVCSVTWPLNGSKPGGDIVFI